MGRTGTLAVGMLWSLSLAGCASTPAVEREPVDPPEEETEAGEWPGEADEVGEAGPLENRAAEAGSAAPSPAEPVETEPAPCPDGRAPLAVKLLVFLRHPGDPVPGLPADGFTLAVDGSVAATGVRVGQERTLCVVPGEREVVARGGAITRSVRATAPGRVQLAVGGVRPGR